MLQENVLPKGTVLRNGKRPYVIQSVLGQGGFGITYLATAEIFVDNIPQEGMFAIKEHFVSSMNMRQGRDVVTSNPNNRQEIKESIKSFLTEARRLNGRKHPNIVRVNESFEENGTAYYVMQYIKGRNLRDYAKGRLTEPEALQIIRTVSSAVSYLHEDRITHLDIKPDNILMKDDGTPVLIDFGLAKGYDSAGRPTRTNKSAGCSPGYAPMEQYVGIKTFSPEADVYALAATLLYMLTGKDPRIASEINPENIAESLKGIASPRVSSAILHGMAKQKEDRTPTVKEFLRELVEIKDSKAEKPSIERPSHATMPISESQQSIWVKPVFFPKPRPSFPTLKRYGNWIFVGGLVLSMFVAGYFMYQSMSSAFRGNEAVKQDTTLLLTTKQPQTDESTATLDNPSVEEDSQNVQQETDDERFSKAMKNNDYTTLIQLAKANYAKAYYPVAKYYYNRKEYDKADLYAKKAVAADVNKKQSQALVSSIIQQQKAENESRRKPEMSNDEIYQQAKRSGDWTRIEALANKGYTAAYYELAKHYYNIGNAAACKKWAEKAVAANVNANNARRLLEDIK